MAKLMPGITNWQEHWIGGVRKWHASFSIIAKGKHEDHQYVDHNETDTLSESFHCEGDLFLEDTADDIYIRNYFGTVLLTTTHNLKELTTDEDGAVEWSNVESGKSSVPWRMCLTLFWDVDGKVTYSAAIDPTEADIATPVARKIIDLNGSRDETDSVVFAFDSTTDGDLPDVRGAIVDESTTQFGFEFEEGAGQQVSRWTFIPDPVEPAPPPTIPDPIVPPATSPPLQPAAKRPKPKPRTPKAQPTGRSRPPRAGRARPPTASARDLARQILNNPHIHLATAHESGVRDGAYPSQQLQDVAAGAVPHRSRYGRAPGGSVTLDAGMLQAILDLSNNYDIGISELAGGEHSVGSSHYGGVAFDVHTINGRQVTPQNPDYRAFMHDAAALGAHGVLGPGYPGHDYHIHVTWPRTPQSALISDLPEPTIAAMRVAPQTDVEQDLFSAEAGGPDSDPVPVDRIYTLASGSMAHLTPNCPALRSGATPPVETSVAICDDYDALAEDLELPICRSCVAMVRASTHEVVSMQTPHGRLVFCRGRLRMDEIGLDVPYERILSWRRKHLSLSSIAVVTVHELHEGGHSFKRNLELAFSSARHLDAFLAEMDVAAGAL